MWGDVLADYVHMTEQLSPDPPMVISGLAVGDFAG
jgi:hypothetical protein